MSPSLWPISKRLTGALTLVIALLGIACASILLVIAEKEISPYAATFDRLSIATVIFLLWHGITRISGRAASSSDADVPKGLVPTLDLVDIGLLLLSGTAFSGSLSLWAWSLTQTSVANSTLLNNMMPIFTTLGAWLLLKESFSPKFLWGMFVAIVGAVLIGLGDLQLTNGLIGDEAALTAALLSAINILCIKQLRIRFDAAWIMLWTSFIGSLLVMTLLFAMQETFFPSTAMGWTAVISLAIFSQALGQGLLTYSLKVFSAGFVSISMLLIPVIAAVLALLMLDERLTLFNWCSFGIVLVGIYIAISSKASETDDETEKLKLVDISEEVKIETVN
ncbi:DMT family transporter [Leptolyngbya cf. ectocarpi LEGE 11479]|uniref:DMT family transporter n=1 Tax=Leptolyngbya cf. ectocarpi LEGE 11479 TaxID=1828722 RepID=A0A929F9X6_LEPEC|nr:DMT family transporter [Leptolyngbya ectocarpi]MBE9067809.1 DMT family transporter [Leptolyngbya cf. ectocarpi LEGE 11479]